MEIEWVICLIFNNLVGEREKMATSKKRRSGKREVKQTHQGQKKAEANANVTTWSPLKIAAVVVGIIIVLSMVLSPMLAGG